MFAQFKSLLDLMDAFPKGDNEACIKHLEQAIWDGTPVSPFEKSSKVYKCGGGRYKCKSTNRYFNVKTGTMFEGTKLELRYWFFAMWVIGSHKKGLTSVDLAKDIHVTQKTAWFLLHRIRRMQQVENNNTLNGTVELDESMVGGLDGNRHVKRKSKNTGASNSGKTWVFGMIERGGKINAWAVPDREAVTVMPLINKYIVKGANVISDMWKSYNAIGKRYNHKALNHDAYEFVSLSDNNLHNNHIESAWKVMKGSIHRMYNHVSDKHLQKYLDEFVFRYNTRDLTDSDKFNWMIYNCNVRTRYIDLVKA